MHFGWICSLSTVLLVVLVPAAFGQDHSYKGKPRELDLDDRALLVMRQLLGDDKRVFEDFFDRHFQQAPMHVKSSSRTRTERISWIKTYRQFLKNEDIDSLLLHNASAFSTRGKLQMGRDIHLLKPSPLPSSNDLWTLAAFLPKSGAKVVTLVDTQGAFKDGFRLVVERMEARSEPVHAFVRLLSHFWFVHVSARLHFIPPDTDRKTKSTPTFSASDLYVIQLDGRQTLKLYNGWYEFPTESDEQDLSVLQETLEKKRGAQPTHIYEVDEGDVIYIPRGCALDSRTPEGKISLHLIVRMSLAESTFKHALHSAIDVLPGENAKGDENPMDKHLAERGPGNTSTWGDLVKAGVSVAADFLTSDLRTFYAVSHLVDVSLEESGGTHTDALLIDKIGKFVTAASQALFDPLLSLLASGEESLQAIASEDVINWAEQVENRGDKGEKVKLDNMFKRCLRFLRENADPSDARTRYIFDRISSLEQTAEEDTRVIETSLLRHGQKIELTSKPDNICAL